MVLHLHLAPGNRVQYHESEISQPFRHKNRNRSLLNNADLETNLRNGGHVDDIATPRLERLAFGEAREPRPLHGHHRSLIVDPEAELVAGADDDLSRTLTKRRTHGDVTNSAEGWTARLIVEGLKVHRGGNADKTLCCGDF